MQREFRHLFLALLFLSALIAGCESGNPQDLQPGNFIYPPALPQTARCTSNSRDGGAGIVDDIEALSGVTYNIRTPLNYEATRGHPLLIVFAPADHSRFASERLVRLTRQATERGFIIAYVNSRRLST